MPAALIGNLIPSRVPALQELKLEAPAGILSYEPIRQSSGCRCRLTERLNSQGLVVRDVEDGIQPCNLRHVVDLICEIEQLEFPFCHPHL